MQSFCSAYKLGVASKAASGPKVRKSYLLRAGAGNASICNNLKLDCVHAELRFTCWMGAYPGLTEHFAKANLDPKANQWDKVPFLSCSAAAGVQGSESEADLS